MIWFPVLVTLVAGMATVFGALFASFVKSKWLEATSLAFATGLMLMVSLGELIPESTEVLGIPLSLLFLVVGTLISLFLDIVLPHHHDHDAEHEHEEEPGHFLEECDCTHAETISRGMVIALVLHNVIEGLATGLTVASNARLGISMAIGIAIHNIPIGATLSVSVLSSGKSRGRAVLTSAMVGLSQPLGALAGGLLMGMPSVETILSICMAMVAGILVFIAFDELWPAARKSGSRNLTIFALVIGICFIPITEILLPF